MSRLVVDTKGLLLIHKQFSSCLHPYKVRLAKTNFSFYKLIHVGIEGASLCCNLFFLGMLKHPPNGSCLTWPHPIRTTNILLVRRWGKSGFLNNPDLLPMSYKMWKQTQNILHKSIWNQCSNQSIAPKKKTLIFATIRLWHTFFEVAIATQQNNYTLTLPSNLHCCMLDYYFLSMLCNLCFATCLCTMLSNTKFWKDKTLLVGNLHIDMWRAMLYLCFQNIWCSFFSWTLW